MSAESAHLKAERDVRIIEFVSADRPKWRKLTASQRAWFAKLDALLAMDVSLFGEMLREHYTPQLLTAMANRPATGFYKLRRGEPMPLNIVAADQADRAASGKEPS